MAVDKSEVAARARPARARPADRPHRRTRRPRSARSTQARNDYAAAESDLKTAEGTLTAARNRLRVIIGRSAGGGRARRARARDQSARSPSMSPIDGTVIARKVGPGQYVRSDSGDPLYAIADLSTMWLKANVPENRHSARARRAGDRGQGHRAAGPRVQGAHHRDRRRLGCRRRGAWWCARRFPIPTACSRPRCSRASRSTIGDGEPCARRAGRVP